MERAVGSREGGRMATCAEAGGRARMRRAWPALRPAARARPRLAPDRLPGCAVRAAHAPNWHAANGVAGGATPARQKRPAARPECPLGCRPAPPAPHVGTQASGCMQAGQGRQRGAVSGRAAHQWTPLPGRSRGAQSQTFCRGNTSGRTSPQTPGPASCRSRARRPARC